MDPTSCLPVMRCLAHLWRVEANAGDYSARSAAIGSIEAALRVGSHVATRATTVRRSHSGQPDSLATPQRAWSGSGVAGQNSRDLLRSRALLAVPKSSLWQGAEHAL